QHGFAALVYGDDPGVNCLSYAALALWFLGYPDQAQQRSQQALALARQLAIPYSSAFALSFAALLHLYRRDATLAQPHAEAAMTIAEEQGFRHWLALGTIVRGSALTIHGQIEEGSAQLHQGLAAWQATGAELSQSWHFQYLAADPGKAG